MISLRYLPVLLWICLHAECHEKLLDEANAAYKAGETAHTLIERQEAFNHALNLFTDFEHLYNPQYGTGVLYYDIANTYYQLEEYPFAVLYYYKALQLMPRSYRVHNNLAITLDKLVIPMNKPASVFNDIFFVHTRFSFPERMQLFFALAMILIVLGSVYVWKPIRIIRASITVVSLCCALMLFSLLYSRYFEPIEGVIVHSSLLYRDAGLQYASVSDQPVLSGNKVKVVDVQHNGQWLKVVTTAGDIGYVPLTAIRVI